MDFGSQNRDARSIEGSQYRKYLTSNSRVSWPFSENGTHIFWILDKTSLIWREIREVLCLLKKNAVLG